MPPIFVFMTIDIKTTIILALVIVVVILSTCNSCKQNKIDKLTAQLEQCKSNDQQGNTRIDTVFVPQFATFAEHAPIPYKVENAKVTVKRVFDTLYIQGLAEADTVYIDTLVNRYYTTNYYSKKYNHKYGTLTTFDTVYNNRLIGTGLDVNLSLPIVTKTVYQTKRKAQLYAGIDAFSDRQFNLTGAGANVLFVSRRALAYQVGAYFTDQSSMNFRASIMFPLTKK